MAEVKENYVKNSRTLKVNIKPNNLDNTKLIVMWIQQNNLPMC